MINKHSTAVRTLRVFTILKLICFTLGQRAQIVNEQVIAIGPGDLLTTPRPGISGFGDVVVPVEQAAVVPAVIQLSDMDDSNVEIVAIDRPVLIPTVTRRPSSVQDLVFVDPISGDIVSVSYNPEYYPVTQPVKYKRTYRMSRARKFPSTYGRRQVRTFRDPSQNSYYSDNTFYDRLRVSRRRRVQQHSRALRQSTPPPSRNDFWDRYLSMLI